MADYTMEYLAVGSDRFEIADATARQDVSDLKEDFDSLETTLETKADEDGSYDNLTSGNAKQLVSTVFTDDSTPYLFRTTGGSADVGDREYVDAIVGGTVALNQLCVVPYTQTLNDVTFTNNGDGSVTINGTASMVTYYRFVDTPMSITGHVYYVDKGADGQYSLYNDGSGVITGDYKRTSVGKATANKFFYCRVDVGSTINNVTAVPQIMDLTQIFGTTIADYVYGLESATAGAGVAWLKANAPKIVDGGYIPFNAGTLQSVVGLSEKRNTGLNQWDEEVELGTISNENGENIIDNNKFRSKNYIRLASGQDYYIEHKTSDVIGVRYYDSSKNFIGTYAITTAEGSLLHRGTASLPNNAMYMRFVNTSTNVYNHDICVNIHWDGEKDGTYEPHTVNTYAFDPTVELRGVPKLKDGKMYFDGDRYLPDGTVQRRYGVVDLGTLTWSHTSAGYFYTTSINTILKKGSAAGGYNHIKCALFVAENVASLNGLTDKSISVDSGGNIQIHDSAYPDNNAFKTAMSGVYLVYEKATASTETAEPYNPVEIVDDFGTEEFITTSLVPVGHETRYAPNLRAKLEMAPNSPDGDGDYIVRQTNGENEYVLLEEELPSAPSSDGTYVLKTTVASGTVTLTWVEET